MDGDARLPSGDDGAMLLYGYCRGTWSSRKIERATYEDVHSGT